MKNRSKLSKSIDLTVMLMVLASSSAFAGESAGEKANHIVNSVAYPAIGATGGLTILSAHERSMEKLVANASRSELDKIQAEKQKLNAILDSERANGPDVIAAERRIEALKLREKNVLADLTSSEKFLAENQNLKKSGTAFVISAAVLAATEVIGHLSWHKADPGVSESMEKKIPASAVSDSESATGAGKVTSAIAKSAEK